MPAVHLEHIDDLVMKLRTDHVVQVMEILVEALGTVNLKLNWSKSKALIPSSSADDELHVGLMSVGLTQVRGSLELLGNA